MPYKRKHELFEKNLKPISKEQFYEAIELAMEDSQSDHVTGSKSPKNNINRWG